MTARGRTQWFKDMDAFKSKQDEWNGSFTRHEERLEKFMDIQDRFMEVQMRINLQTLESSVKLRERVEKLENLNALYAEAEKG